MSLQPAACQSGGLKAACADPCRKTISEKLQKRFARGKGKGKNIKNKSHALKHLCVTDFIKLVINRSPSSGKTF